MIRLFRKKSEKITKGTSTAALLSIGIHLLLFLLAGMLVVFTVVRTEEVEFEPPKSVERPKMKLKKPKVKVKKSSKPKSTQRIVSKANPTALPEMSLPEMGGMGDGLTADIGSFDLMMDLDEGLFGGAQTIGNDFEGTFYDFNRNRFGKKTAMGTAQMVDILARFTKNGWNPSSLSGYYRSPQKLYTTSFAIPPVQSGLAPLAFGEPETAGYLFALHYEGELVHNEDITFRFWGLGDDFLVVRVDGEVVLSSSWPRPSSHEYDTKRIGEPWQSSDPQNRNFWLGDHLSRVGDWITLEAGVPLDMEVLFGEVPGGLFQCMLVVEVKGEVYPRNPDRGGPVLPIFRTAELPLDLVEQIHADLDPYDACVTNGPIFCDYDAQPTTAKKTEPVIDPAASNSTDAAEIPISKMRTWNTVAGKTIDGEFLVLMNGNVTLETAAGKQMKFPLSELSEPDQKYATLASPPGFSINFSKSSKSLMPPQPSPFEGSLRPLQLQDYSFGVKLKQQSSDIYPFELKMEYFVFGEEVDGNNYVLLDRQVRTFIPADQEGRLFEHKTAEPVRLKQTAIRAISPMRGTEYGGYLVVLSDERGEIIQYKTGSDWMRDIVENLRILPVGKHFDKTGARVGPPRPTSDDRPYHLIEKYSGD